MFFTFPNEIIINVGHADKKKTNLYQNSLKVEYITDLPVCPPCTTLFGFRSSMRALTELPQASIRR